MPQLISQNEVKIEWSDLERWKQIRLPKSTRSSGVHLSGIIRHVLTKLGKLTPDDESDEMPLRMCVGMAMENWLVGLMDADQFVWQPGEWERDEVFGTPDGFNRLGECLPNIVLPFGSHILDPVLEEIKGATWKSERTHGDVLRESIWMWQLAGNCYAMRCRHARLHIVWICGDYRPPSPKYCRYLIRFEQEELDEFWRNIVLKYRDEAPREEH